MFKVIMEALPDELWGRILEIGVLTANFTYKDLCCVSICCRRLHKLSSEDSLWSYLLSSDFPQVTISSSPSSAKSLYRIRYERDRERKLTAHRRVLLRKESQIAEHLRKLREVDTRLREETERLKSAVAELSNLRKVRQASVALNVWQPEVIRGRQKQIVEQSVVCAESRLDALKMEIRLCKQQKMVFEKASRDEKQRLDKAREELESLKYHPLRDYKSSGGDNERKKMMKKLKKCETSSEK